MFEISFNVIIIFIIRKCSISILHLFSKFIIEIVHNHSNYYAVKPQDMLKWKNNNEMFDLWCEQSNYVLHFCWLSSSFLSVLNITIVASSAYLLLRLSFPFRMRLKEICMISYTKTSLFIFYYQPHNIKKVKNLSAILTLKLQNSFKNFSALLFIISQQ